MKRWGMLLGKQKLKKNYIGILEIKSIVLEVKNLFGGFSCRQDVEVGRMR